MPRAGLRLLPSARPAEAVAEIEQRLGPEAMTFYRLPSVEITASVMVRTSLDAFHTHPVSAGKGAATWLRERALVEHRTARTVLALGGGRICGFYRSPPTW